MSNKNLSQLIYKHFLKKKRKNQTYFNTKPPPSQAGVFWQKLIKLVETVN